MYTIAITAIYSLIPYKTPWCAITFLQGMIVLAVIGAAALVRTAGSAALKGLVGVVIIAAAVQLGSQSEALNFKYYAEAENPYAYVHTSKDFIKLVNRVEELAKISPGKTNMLVAVVVSPESVHDMWPLPWYLRKFGQVGYFRIGEVPKELNAEVTIASSDMTESVSASYGAGRGVSMFGLRPDVFLSVFVRADLWDAFLKMPKKGGR